MHLDNVEKVTITRSFSHKIQLNQYEPMEASCSISAELGPLIDEAEIAKRSQELHQFCQEQVVKDLESSYKSLKPPF